MPIIEDCPQADQFGYHANHYMFSGEAEIIKFCMPDSGIVFDVGANLGEWSACAMESHPNITIYAFEPVPDLLINLKRKFLGRRISLHCLAFSNAQALREFYFYPTADGLGGLVFHPDIELEKGLPRRLTVPTDTIDSFCVQEGIERIAFLKIDVEGAEYDVLCGAATMLREQRIDCLQFEYNATFKDAKRTLKDMYTMLNEYEYDIYRISKKFLIHVPYWRDALETYFICNYLAIPRKKNS